MRGKGHLIDDARNERGITPAYAGKRLHRFDHCRLQRDHPRVCGEKRFVDVAKGPHRGSPPRMRGKVKYNKVRAQQDRITPAYAGKS